MSEFTEEQFVELVKRSEIEAYKNINAYKIKLALFAMLGYGVIFSIVIALILLVGGTISVALVSSSFLLLLIKKKVIFAILAAIWVFLKALWVKFDPPKGHELERKKYPHLFKEIDELTKALKALKIHQVIIEDNLNAAVVQHPKFGLLGGQRNILLLGVQLLMVLSPEEMRSVLAHEFGHLSGNHSRFSAWIYRVRVSWFNIMNAFEGSDSFGAGMMRSFFNWYAPKFSAYSFALARNNEYEADQVAAKLTSSEIAAKALVNVYVKAPYIDSEFWGNFFKKAESEPNPPVLPYKGLATFLKETSIPQDNLLDLINKEMQVETHYSDTHPSLKDRTDVIMGAVGKIIIPDVAKRSAAEAWLGDNYSELVSQFDQEWLTHNGDAWKARYEYVTAAKSKLDANQDVDLDTLTDDDLWDLAQYREEFENEDTALLAYQCFQRRDPTSKGAAYCVGRILAAKEDEQAIQHLRIAIKNPNLIEQAALVGYHLLKDKGKEQDAERWWEEVVQISEAQRVDDLDRMSVTHKDEFQMPSIDRSLLLEMRRVLTEHKNVGKSWLAEKILKNKEGAPVYIVAFYTRGFALSADKIIESVATELKMDADIFIVAMKGDHRAIAKKVKKLGIKMT